MFDRRDFLKTVVGGSASLLTLHQLGAAHALAGPLEYAVDPWAQVPRILARIKAPVFPRRDFNITKFGARGDGKTDCTEAFRKAIVACNRAGGGRVLVPAGVFSTGPIHLKSNVNLHVTRGATIKFDRDPKKYLPLVFTRWEGMELMNYSPFIYAFGQRNIGLTGEGIIDGNADCDHWWPWKGRTGCGWKKGIPEQTKARALLYDYVAKATPVNQRLFGEGAYLRPQFIQPYRCQNVLIEGVILRRSPMWQIHPVMCSNVIVRGVRVQREEGASSQSGPNADGCNPESCNDVLIENCFFDTGDDCIAIKAGRNDDGRRLSVPSQNIIIRGCHMEDGHGGITLGSEISGGVRNVFAMDCNLSSPNLDHGLRFKNNAMRGGLLENINFRDITIGEVAHAALTVDFNYEEGARGKHTPVLRNLQVQNLKSGKSRYAIDLQGLNNAPIIDVRLENCTFENTAEPSIVKNVKGLTLRNVTVNGKEITEIA
jgi:polygalacturonase